MNEICAANWATNEPKDIRITGNGNISQLTACGGEGVAVNTFTSLSRATTMKYHPRLSGGAFTLHNKPDYGADPTRPMDCPAKGRLEGGARKTQWQIYVCQRVNKSSARFSFKQNIIKI